MTDKNSKSKEIVLLNGKLIENQEARFSVFDPGFLYGLGLFETMRAYNNKIVYLDRHLKRIKDSAKLIKIAFPSLSGLKQAIKKAVKESGFSDAYVRLTLWKASQGANNLITVKKYKPYSVQAYKKGFSLSISSYRQNEGSFLAKIKTSNRLLYELALGEARGKGFDEAVILNNSGYVTEASRSNIFLVKDDQFFTPKLECGCLDGITRRVIFDLANKHKIKLQEDSLTIQDLYNADGVFLTNSLIGIMPVKSVEQYLILRPKIIEFLRQRYQLLLKNGT